jgi:hypothetical protein
MTNPPADILDFTQSELVSSYYDGLRKCVDFVQTQIIPVLNGQLNLCQQEEAILGIFYRMHVLGSSLTRLNNKLDFSAVATIARTMFELLLDIKILASPSLTSNELERFRAFSGVERFRKSSNLLKLQVQHPGIEKDSIFDDSIRKQFVESPGRQGAVESQVVSLWGKNKNKPKWPDHWTGSSVRDRAKLFGPFYEQEYLEIYSLLSWFVHSGNAGYAGLSESSLEWVYGISMNISRKMYIEALEMCAKTFSLNHTINGFSQVIESLKNAPEKILIDHGLRKSRDRDDGA